MNKSVLILSPQPFFETRGTPLNVREMLYALSEANYDITLLAYPFGENLEIPNVKIIRSPKVIGINKVKIGPSVQKIILDFFFFFKALKLALTNHYDLFHGIEEAAHIACVLSTIKNKKFIADVDSCIPEQLKDSGFIKNKFLLDILIAIEKRCFGKASRVLTVCQALTNEVRNIQPQAKISQIEDFPLEEIGSNTIDLRKTYKIPDHKKIILYAGNFEPYQGVELLIKAFNNTHGAHLVLVGGSEKHIQEFKQLSNSETTFTGNLDSSYMPSIHEQADILVSPRLCGKNTPLKIYSYMNAGKLIVATNIISHTQVLSDKEAILCEPSVEGITKALNDAIKNNHTDKTAAAKNLAQTKFSKLRFREEIKKMYQEVLCQ